MALTAIVDGADLESDDELRTCMLQAFAAPAQGGAWTDYVEWAEAVPGVTRAWSAPNAAGPGTVVVYVMMDDSEAAYGGFPQGQTGVANAETRPSLKATGDLLTVANALFLEQPATPLVYAAAPLPNSVAFTIAGLASAGPTVQANVRAAIAQVFLENGSPGGVRPGDRPRRIADGASQGGARGVVGLPAHRLARPGSGRRIGAVDLLQRGVVGIRAEGFLDGPEVGVVAVRGDLDAL